MGIFKNIGKIEELIEANVPGSWCIYHNALLVKDLPENYKNAMLQFGYTENAPIFKQADLGIVGDAFEILPNLIQKIRDKNNG